RMTLVLHRPARERLKRPTKLLLPRRDRPRKLQRVSMPGGVHRLSARLELPAAEHLRARQIISFVAGLPGLRKRPCECKIRQRTRDQKKKNGEEAEVHAEEELLPYECARAVHSRMAPTSTSIRPCSPRSRDTDASCPLPLSCR